MRGQGQAKGVRTGGKALKNRFGREVRRRRVALGLTIDLLAEKAELSPNYLGTIENGRRDPSLSVIAALAEAFEVPIAELFDELDPTKAEQPRAAKRKGGAA